MLLPGIMSQGPRLFLQYQLYLLDDCNNVQRRRRKFSGSCAGSEAGGREVLFKVQSATAASLALAQEDVA